LAGSFVHGFAPYSIGSSKCFGDDLSSIMLLLLLLKQGDASGGCSGRNGIARACAVRQDSEGRGLGVQNDSSARACAVRREKRVSVEKRWLNSTLGDLASDGI
jgi:hypothetical protein